MHLLDVSVVVATHRGDHPQHGQVRRWFDELLATRSDFGVPMFVWASFLRVSTNRRIFEVPTPVGDAFAFVASVTAQPGHVEAEPGPRHLDLLRSLCEGTDAVGDLVPDAVLGAVAQEHAATVATLDRDFARFGMIDHVRLNA